MYSSSQNVVPGSAIAASPGNLLEMQMLGSHPRPAQLKTRAQQTNPPGNSDACQKKKLRTTDVYKTTNTVPGIEPVFKKTFHWCYY